MRRWTNMNQQRWFSGDTHVHFLSTQGSGEWSLDAQLRRLRLPPPA